MRLWSSPSPAQAIVTSGHGTLAPTASEKTHSSTAPIETDFYTGNFGIAQRGNDSCLEPLDFTLCLCRALGLADSKIRHDRLKISHQISPEMWGQAPIVLPTRTGEFFPLKGCASADGAGAMPDASVGVLSRALGRSSKRTAAINDGNPTGFGFDDQALQDPVSGKGDDITGVEREHTLVALEACARA